MKSLEAAKARRQTDSLSVEVETLRSNLEEECRISAKLQAELDRIKGGSRTETTGVRGGLNGLVLYYPHACRKATGLTTGLLYMLEHHNVAFETKTPEVRLCALCSHPPAPFWHPRCALASPSFYLVHLHVFSSQELPPYAYPCFAPPMVKLPDGTVIAQTPAIMNTVGQALGLGGASASEEAHAMMVMFNLLVSALYLLPSQNSCGNLCKTSAHRDTPLHTSAQLCMSLHVSARLCSMCSLCARCRMSASSSPTSRCALLTVQGSPSLW